MLLVVNLLRNFASNVTKLFVILSRMNPFENIDEVTSGSTITILYKNKQKTNSVALSHQAKYTD
jgi:hypothetical protein